MTLLPVKIIKLLTKSILIFVNIFSLSYSYKMKIHAKNIYYKTLPGTFRTLK